MIKPKLKECSICHKLSVLWRSNPKTCKECAQKDKVQQTPHKYQTKEIKKVSTRMQKLNAMYKVLRDSFMKHHPKCEANLQGCTKTATECHHSKGRGQYYLDDSTYIALCHNCHVWVTHNNEAAMAMGLTQSRLAKPITKT